MTHEESLIATLAMAVALAFALGWLAARLRLSPLVGYLLAGIALGPHTPGWVADTHLAPQLAEIGVMLLMFGVGTHFSLRDLLAVKAVALPGALVQIVVATALGALAAHAWGWAAGAAWCSDWRSRWRARWYYCGRSRRSKRSTAPTAASPSAGWWSRTW